MGHGLCKSCYAKKRYFGDGGKIKARMQAYAASHPAQRHATWRKYAYGLTEAEWYRLYEKQEGRCAICRAAEPINVLNVDHDHETDEVRGLLCGRCNKALGYLDDRPDLLVRAQRYLERNEEMSRKQDPIYAVVDFFENEPVAVVRSAYSLVRRIVTKRTAVVVAAPVRRKRAKKVVQPLADLTISPTASQPPVEAEKAKAARRRMQAPPESTAKPIVDPSLPGIGPATIGD